MIPKIYNLNELSFLDTTYSNQYKLRKTIGGDLKSLPEDLRHAMQYWTTGVCIVCGQSESSMHGMTVNSFTSVSLDPPIITVTLAKKTRTLNVVQESGKLSISILNHNQKDLADRFAGKIADSLDRFDGVKLIKLPHGLPGLEDALASLECKVRDQIPLQNSVLLLADVCFAQVNHPGKPLVYHNRGYWSL